jgi:hypothetical protein
MYSSPACSVENVKLFMLAREKSSRYISNKFTLNWKMLALLLLIWKIMGSFRKMAQHFYIIAPSYSKCKCGVVVVYYRL